jgi:hypothetical protein
MAAVGTFGMAGLWHDNTGFERLGLVALNDLPNSFLRPERFKITKR